MRLATLSAFAAATAFAHTPRPDDVPSAALRTEAERSDYAATTRHDTVVSFVWALEATRPGLVAGLSIGVTTQGRQIPMMVLSRPRVATPAECRAADDAGKIVVLVIANIHAGECDGKEALLALARDLTRPDTPDHALLDRLVLLLVPNFNPDGEEARGPAERLRPGQRGPAEVGTRENAQGLDLNRDFMKLDSPEVRALVGVMRDWRPHLFVDCHTTNGSAHRYLVTYAGVKPPTAPPSLESFSTHTMLPAIGGIFEQISGLPAFWYGSYAGEWGGVRDRTRWESFPAEPRFGTTYAGLRGMLSVLVESYSYAPFADRVRGSRDFALATLRYAAEHAEDIRAALRAATAADAASRVALAWDPAPRPEPVTILGYVEIEEGGRSVPTQRHAEYRAQLWDRATPTVEIERPAGYLVPASMADVLGRLGLHGIAAPAGDGGTVLASRLRITKATPASRLFQNRRLTEYDAHALDPEPVALDASWRFVRADAASPLSALAVYLLEPRSPDSFAAWGFIGPMAAGDEYPVRRVPQRLRRDAASPTTNASPTPPGPGTTVSK